MHTVPVARKGFLSALVRAPVAIPEPSDLTAPRFLGRGVVSSTRAQGRRGARALRAVRGRECEHNAHRETARRTTRQTLRRAQTEHARASWSLSPLQTHRALRAKQFAEGGLHELTVRARRLAPARYTLTLIAHDAAGNRSRALRLTLRVLPARPHAPPAPHGLTLSSGEGTAELRGRHSVLLGCAAGGSAVVGAAAWQDAQHLHDAVLVAG